MARRAVPVQTVVDVYRRWQAGHGLRAIARDLGLARNTVRQWIRRAEAAGLRRESPLSAAEWERFARAESRSEPVERARLWAGLEERREQIAAELQSNRVATVWERLRAADQVHVSLSTFRRFVEAELPAPVSPQRVAVHGPGPGVAGEVAELDFGRLGYWCDPRGGPRRLLWAFVMVLVYSRHMFVRPVLKLDARTWLECHQCAFQFFGGVPRRLVVDNLKAGVVKADLYTPELNRAYAALAVHYGVLVDPARSLHPKDKPHVERMIAYVREHLYRGREERFADLEGGALEAARWCREEAGLRLHRSTGQRPWEQFQAEEVAALLPLPPTPWELCTWQRVRVAPDAHCAVAGGFYSVPYRLIGKELDVRVTDREVEFHQGAELVRTHPRVAKGRRQTEATDLPADRLAYYMRTPQWCLERARDLGPSVQALVNELLTVNVLTRLRQVQGILRLADTYGATRLDAACARSLRFGDGCYRTVKNILQRGLDREEAPQPLPLLPASVGAFLRGPAAYAVITPPAGGLADGSAREQPTGLDTARQARAEAALGTGTHTDAEEA